MNDDYENREEEQASLRARLEQLHLEHRDLDEVIDKLSESPLSNQLQIQRLKKRKLVLKDMMGRIEDRLIPDIIA
ncbi:YdcH family protein [Aquibaculum sediminis]|uniref:YdcH family protein n=1 Tax=Aquibaculum sediminis TaxID=3231907 RepID=UPI0034514046